MTVSTPLSVDIDQLLRGKNPRLAALLPGFVRAYLKRIIHQEEVNDILSRFSHMAPVDFVHSALSYLEITYTSEGIDRLDPAGRYLFAGNHPFGGMDGMMLCDELHRYFGSGRVIANDLLMNVRPMAPLFIPINKHGGQNSHYAQSFRLALQAPGQVATFPAGLCSRRTKGVVSDLAWKPSFIKNAINSQRDIVPIYFEGHLSNFFYRLSSLRSAMGIRANIEMLYLVDELFAQRGKHFRLVFGTPIPWQELSASGRSSISWADEVKKRVYALKNR